MINRERLVDTFCELVQIDSPSGEEETVAAYLDKCLDRLGLSVRRDAYGNLIAGDAGDHPLLLSAHMDTVEPGRGVKPLVEGDDLLSEGATILGGDCKAGIAAILEALESLHEAGTPHRSVEVAFTREEELGLVGARNLDFSMITATEAIVFDGEGEVSQITSASPTYVGFDLEITGRAAHAGVEPEKGLSAIRVGSEIVTRLPQGRLDDETTFNVGAIQGGSVRNAVPENAVVKGEFRSRNRDTLDRIRREIDSVIEDVRGIFPDAVIRQQLDTQFEAYSLSETEPTTKMVLEAVRSLGLEPLMRPSGGGTDGSVFRLHGISAVVVGMADYDAHTVREHVSIPGMVDAARLCEALLKV